MAEKAKWNWILTLLRRGLKPSEIKDQTDASYSMTRRVNERQSAERSERDIVTPIRTPELVAQVAQSLENNPPNSEGTRT